MQITDSSQQSFFFESPVGRLRIDDNGMAVTAIDFCFTATHKEPAAQPQTALQRQIALQLQEYFQQQRKVFSLPIELQVTPFQQRVLKALMNIDYAATVTYGALAHQLQSHARAIGGACRRNPIPIIIPCHRVVAASGLGGFSGAVDGPLVQSKQWLLQHEQK